MGGVIVTSRGPLFDGRAGQAIAAAVDKSVDTVARDAVDEVRAILSADLQNATGYYESQIQTERQSDSQVVSDAGVVYGPWLEGVSSRNASTGFAGYGQFRRAADRVRQQATETAEQVVRQHLSGVR
ncbi:hypothetical protein SAMN04488563_1660 [Jiangella alkaliphila]|uniref:Uncharacterized protein n=1 Tax=Jiangella alkaliphila TaxID=419479 RepID=A0A1H2IEN5_9ACTN|nr:hypothetical protein SAMN04488563_1660 [Jiangella alkaliphila]